MSDDPTGKSGRRASFPKEYGDDEGSIFHRVRSDVLKKKVEAMLKEGVIKNLVSDLKLPREIVTHLMTQIDETKQAALGVVSREVRLFFENTNLSDELARVLSQLSFEITTRVRFVRNEDASQESTKKGAPSGESVSQKHATEERPRPSGDSARRSPEQATNKPVSHQADRGEGDRKAGDPDPAVTAPVAGGPAEFEAEESTEKKEA